MGHSLGVDDHYFSKTDVEKHREKYAEHAIPNLRIESKTANQTEKTIIELRNKIAERDQQINAINDKLTKFEPLLNLLGKNPQLNKMLEDISEGRFVRIETERTQPVAMIPMKVLDELMKKPVTIDGEEAIVFDFDEIRDLSRKLPDKEKKTNHE
jgi:uncharacterized coiled-coil protein SlyX